MAKRLVTTGLAQTPSGRPARRLMFNDATGMMEYQYAARNGRTGRGPLLTWITYARVDHGVWMREDIMRHYRKLNGKVEF